MSNKPEVNKYIPCIPLTKSYVHGYYEKRNGKLVWIRPYENGKHAAPEIGVSEDNELQSGQQMHIKMPPPGGADKPEKILTVPQIQNESWHWLVNLIISCVKTIRGFEDGEIVRLKSAILTARSLVKELGYYDKGVSVYFDVPEGKATKLDVKASRETEAMYKNLKRASRRVTRTVLREKVQRMCEELENAL